nr:MAG TPA: hypothetical protein [Bacteriophage sp.]
MVRILRPGQQNTVAFVYTNTHNLGFTAIGSGAATSCAAAR